MAPFSRPYRLVGESSWGSRFSISSYGTRKAAEKQIDRWFREYSVNALVGIDLLSPGRASKTYLRDEQATQQKGA